MGRRLEYKGDCISFDVAPYTGYDNGGLKSLTYQDGLCISVWLNYKCQGKGTIFRTDVFKQRSLTNIPQYIGTVKSVSRVLC